MTDLASLINASDPAFFTQSDENLHDLSERLLLENATGAIVLSDSREVAGVITEHDIVRETFLKNVHLYDVYVRDAMTEDVVKCSSPTSLSDALALMVSRSIRHLVVNVGNTFLGFVSIHDVLQKMRDNTKQEAGLLRDRAQAHQYSEAA